MRNETSAFNKGYRVTEGGRLINPNGCELKPHCDNGYLYFKIKTPESIKKIKVHRLQAFQKYGKN